MVQCLPDFQPRQQRGARVTPHTWSRRSFLRAAVLGASVLFGRPTVSEEGPRVRIVGAAPAVD
jgi:hypothetical protein